MPTSDPLAWVRGDTTIINGAATVLSGGVDVAYPLDPTTQVLRFTAKLRFADADAQAVIAVSSLDGSIEVTDGAGGLFTITIEPADYQNAAANPIGNPLQLKYDFQVAGANGQNVHTLALGPLTLNPDVTTADP